MLRICEELHGKCEEYLSPLSLLPLKQMQEDEVQAPVPFHASSATADLFFLLFFCVLNA
jgi:hypothetical protein